MHSQPSDLFDIIHFESPQIQKFYDEAMKQSSEQTPQKSFRLMSILASPFEFRLNSRKNDTNDLFNELLEQENKLKSPFSSSRTGGFSYNISHVFLNEMRRLQYIEKGKAVPERPIFIERKTEEFSQPAEPNKTKPVQSYGLENGNPGHLSHFDDEALKRPPIDIYNPAIGSMAPIGAHLRPIVPRPSIVETRCSNPHNYENAALVPREPFRDIRKENLTKDISKIDCEVVLKASFEGFPAELKDDLENSRNEEENTNGNNEDVKKRKRKSNSQLKVLKLELEREAFWDKEKILQVSKSTGLSESQVYKWFWDQKKKNSEFSRDHNERNKVKKDEEEKAEDLRKKRRIGKEEVNLYRKDDAISKRLRFETV